MNSSIAKKYENKLSQNRLILQKCHILWKKMQPKLFQNCANWTNKQTNKKQFSSQITPRKKLCLENQGIQLFSRKIKERHFKPKLFQRNRFTVKKLEMKLPEKYRIQYKCLILWKTQPSLFQCCANWTNIQNHFQTKLRLENSFFIQKLQGNYFKKQIMVA